MDYIQEAVEVHSHSSRGVINMPNTLRRKMFKLGGSANTHGVGITSGLKMKKGGKVEPQATFGVGNNALRKIGPDGKEREAHFAFLPFLGTIGSGAAGLASRAIGLPALRALGSAIKQGTTQPLRQFVTKGDDIVKMVRPERAALGQSRVAASGAYSPVVSRVVGQTTPSGITQAVRALQLATPIGGATGGITGLTMAGLDRLGITKPGPDDSLLESGARGLGKISLDISPIGLPLKAAGALLSTEDRQLPGSLFDILAGTTKTDDDDTKKSPKEEIGEQESQMEKLRSDAEEKVALYQSLMGTPDNTSAYAKALLNFGATALAGTGDTKTDLARAVQAGTEPLVAEAEARKATDQSIRSLAIQEVIAKDADDRKLLQTAAASGPRALNRMTRALEARDAGVTVAAEVDAKGKLTNATKGVVLADLDGVFGGKFIAVNQDLKADSFNNIEEALSFAATGG